MKTAHNRTGALRVTIFTAAIATMLTLGACGGSGSTSKQLGSSGSTGAIPTTTCTIWLTRPHFDVHHTAPFKMARVLQ
ncbi:hypothetical protein [Caballeronia sp. M23-90]